MVRATCERIFFLKGEKSLSLKKKKKKKFKVDLILPLPTSCDLWACEGNLSFATFRLFFFMSFFFSLRLSGIQFSSRSFTVSTKQQ